MRLGGRVFIALCLTLILTSAAGARTLYVATGGRNANAGTQAAPLRTITYAASVAVPGDVIYVRGGVYYTTVTISSKGRSSAHITFQSAPGETAIIDGVSTPADANLVTLQEAAYVDFSGFEVRNAKRIGISLWGVRSVRIARNHIHHSTRNGIYSGSPSAGPSTEIVIEDNDVHDNVLENRYHPMRRGGWAGAVSIAHSARARATRNRVHHNFGEGIIAGLSDDITIDQNEVFDNFSSNIYMDNARRVRVDRNFVYNSGDSSVYRFGFPPIGIAAANEKWPRQNPLRDIVVTNNIVLNTRWGFYYGAYEAGGGLKNTTVANNTFYKAAVALIAIERGAHAGSVVMNNIFYGGGSDLAAVEGGGVSFHNNSWFGRSPGRGGGAGDVTADPRLAHPGGRTAADYKLLPASPLIGRGSAVSSVTTDFFGTPRRPPFDIGAHQLSTGPSSASSSRERERVGGRQTRVPSPHRGFLRWGEGAHVARPEDEVSDARSQHSCAGSP